MGRFRVSHAALSNGMGSILKIPPGRLMPHGRILEFEDSIAGVPHGLVKPRDLVKPRNPGRTEGMKSSVALNNLRALVILIVVGFHSALAYLGSQPATPFAFDQSPFEWRAFPILDSHRWFGFDIFCAWQDVYLMALMFFLSALFTWPSLTRKGSARFLADRFLRLGVPFALAVTVLVPIAIYPAYLVTAVDPSVSAYARHFMALPFWPNGPMWFLWQLL